MFIEQLLTQRWVNDLGNNNDAYNKLFSAYTVYQVFLNIFAIIFTAIVMYFIADWFSGVIFYIVFIFIFCLFYFGIRIIFLTSVINKLIVKTNNFIIKKGLERAIESEDGVRYRKRLIQNALNKVKHGDADEKWRGINQLEQLSEGLDHSESKYLYKALLNIIESESEGVYAKLIIRILNKIQKYE